MRTRSRLQSLGMIAGPLLAIAVFASLPDTYAAADGSTGTLGARGRATAALAVWMACWWMTEAIALYATALLPIAVLPLVGAASIRQAAAPYSHELIYLFMGGFMLALSMRRWRLDQRISLLALRLTGTQPRAVVGGFMLVTAALSMWVSNTATAVMMLPIAVGVIGLVEGPQGGPDLPSASPDSGFACCLLLGIAYAASIGGVGTLIGTPPNLFLASYAASNLGIEISFVRWLGLGLPLVAIFLPLTWLLLTRVLFRLGDRQIEGGRRHLDERLDELGPVSRGEWVTLCVFAATALAWITRPWLVELELLGRRPLAGLSDPGIAIIAALSLFLIPVDWKARVQTMDWETASRLPWGLLILFGGGLSLAAAIEANGVGEFLGHNVRILEGVPPIVLTLGVVTLLIFLTEITSNTATAATMIPILASLAPGLDVHPLYLAVPAAIAASCAFMLPVATPPNAVIFGSGFVRLDQMSRAGIWLNLCGIVIITTLCYALVLPLLASG